MPILFKKHAFEYFTKKYIALAPKLMVHYLSVSGCIEFIHMS